MIKKQNKKAPFASPLREIYLKQAITPKAYESNGDSWINFGLEAPYKNLYPQFLIEMYNNSATHRAITDAASSYIAGNGILIEENTDILATSKLNLLLQNINSKENIEQLLNKVAKDLYLQGAIALNIIYTKDKTAIASITHIPVEKIRIGTPNDNGVVDEYWISADWSNIRKKENTPMPIPAFNPNDRTANNQLLYVRDYTPGLDLYGAPSYSASTNWILTDGLISEYHYNNVNGGFSPTTWINFNSGQPSEEEQQTIENAINNKMAGVGGKKMVLTFTDEGVNVPTIQNLSLSEAHNQYLALNTLIVQNLMIGHRVVSPSLMGVKTEGQLGGKNEMLDAYELYSRSVIEPYQKILVETFAKLFSINGINIPFNIKTLTPFAHRFGTDILQSVLTPTEIREELGLQPLEDNQSTIDAVDVVVDNKEKTTVPTGVETDGAIVENVAGTALNGAQIASLLEIIVQTTAKILTIASAKAITKSAFPALADNQIDDIFDNLSNVPISPNDIALNKKNSIDDIKAKVMKLGEHESILLKDYNILAIEDTLDELEEDNYEMELNSKVELAVSSGNPEPDLDASQDGTSKQSTEIGNKFKVRYRYTGSQLPERDFCQLMMSLSNFGIIYRKEDILEMSKDAVNPGWGPGGSSTYSIWLNKCCNPLGVNKLELYKGGANCYHRWVRIILVLKEDGTEDIIGTTEARRRGFAPAPNKETEWAVNPIDLPNNGFLPTTKK